MEIFNVNCSLNDCLSCAIKWQRVTINQSNDFNWSESGRIFSSWFETKNKKSRTERNQVELLFELINKFFTLYSNKWLFLEKQSGLKWTIQRGKWTVLSQSRRLWVLVDGLLTKSGPSTLSLLDRPLWPKTVQFRLDPLSWTSIDFSFWFWLYNGRWWKWEPIQTIKLFI